VGLKIFTATAQNYHNLFGKKVQYINLAVKYKVDWYLCYAAFKVIYLNSIHHFVFIQELLSLHII